VDKITITVEKSEERQRLDKFLVTRLAPMTRTRIKALMDDNRLMCCDQIITSASRLVREGETYTLTIPPVNDADPIAEAIPLNILYEDDDLLVLDKAAGMVVHPAPGHSQSTLVNALLAHCRDSLSGIGGVKRPGIVHRLDKETSGLMVVAKNDFTHHGLSAQFANRTLSRSYQALVWGVPSPKQGTIEKNIGRSPHNRQKMAVVSKGGKPATTHYNVLKKYVSKMDATQRVSLVQCDLQTGRTHQIRVHMTHIGHPLLGDPLYGRIPKHAKKAFDLEIIEFPRQALHAFELRFIHPRTEKSMVFQAPLPEDIEQLISLF
jgi:23S rRNA pseudouridine1911/1915/1917 synthase